MHGKRRSLSETMTYFLCTEKQEKTRGEENRCLGKKTSQDLATSTERSNSNGECYGKGKKKLTKGNIFSFR